MRFLVLGWLIGIGAVAAYSQTDADAYREAMQQCETAKQAGDFPAMAAAMPRARAPPRPPAHVPARPAQRAQHR